MEGPVRSGSCNLCGACCGAGGNPNPWPDAWREGYRTQDKANLNPLVQIIGTPGHGDPIGYAVRIGNTTYRGVWVPGAGWCKDSPPWGNPDSYVEECPFLEDDPGDGTRPCALFGQPGPLGEFREAMCGDDKSPPPVMINVEWVQRWAADHPDCGYDWT